MGKFIITILIALTLSINCYAGELVHVKNNKMGRANHSFLYKQGCKSCHKGNGYATANDKACVACHGKINTIEFPKQKLPIDNPGANPHQSYHYKNGASCLACHSEHTLKAPTCAECHRTWFHKM